MPPIMILLLAAVLVMQVRANGDQALPDAGIEVRGKVIDAETGSPIENFKVIVGSPYNDIHTTWQGHLVTEHTSGVFVWRVDRAWRRTRLRITAKGYRPGISPTLRQGAGHLNMTFKLRPDDGLSGVVQDANGQVVKGAQVALTTQTFETIVEEGKLRYANGKRLGARVILSDDDGRFSLPPESDPYLIVVSDLNRGFAVVESSKLGKQDRANLTVQLQPWCRIEGVSVDEVGNPMADVNYAMSVGWQPEPEWPVLGHRSNAKTDEEGKFVCEHVAGGPHFLQSWKQNARGAKSFGTSHRLTAIAGQTMHLNLGSQLRTVVGRFETDDKLPEGFKWDNMIVRFTKNSSQPKIRVIRIQDINEKEGVEKMLRDAGWEPKKANAIAELSDDGSFLVNDLTPGSYTVSFVGKPGTAESKLEMRTHGNLSIPLVDKEVAVNQPHDFQNVFVLVFGT